MFCHQTGFKLLELLVYLVVTGTQNSVVRKSNAERIKLGQDKENGNKL